MRRIAVLLSLVGCGRLGFDPIALENNGDGGTGDGTSTRNCFVELGVGDEHACARHQDGSVWCWGRNNQGNLGIGTLGGPDLQPMQVQAGPFSRLAVGDAHTCVIHRDSSTVECWGNDGNGVLGPNGGSDSGVATAIPGIVTAELHTAGSYACARIGTTYHCWGDADAGQLGDGIRADNRITPGPMSESIIERLEPGEDSGCIFLASGIRCWGINTFGQLAAPPTATTDQCKDSQDTTNLPCSVAGVMLPAFSTGVKQLSLGRSHSCAIDLDDELWCWGSNADGRLGDGTTTSRSVPARVTPLAKVRSVVAGAFHTCARLVDDTVSCWGIGTDGELGDGLENSRSVPGPVPGLTGVTQLSLASSGRTICALDATGVSCWGDNSYEIAGTTTGNNAEVPQRVLSGCP